METYRVEFVESGKTYRDERIFPTLDKAIEAGWHYAENREVISQVSILTMDGSTITGRRMMQDSTIKAKPKRATSVLHLPGFDVEWATAIDRFSEGRIIDLDEQGILICQYIWVPGGREDGPILFFTWYNLPPLTIRDKQPTE